MKLKKISIIAFFSGLFLIGLGGGISFAEFSSFQYGGEKDLRGEMTAETIQMTVEEDVETIYIQAGRYGFRNMRIEEDSSLAERQILIEINCNKNMITPYINEEKNLYLNREDRELEQGETAYILNYSEWNREDEAAVFFKVKDDVLDSLKNRKVYTYLTDYLGETVVKIPPSLAGAVKIN